MTTFTNSTNHPKFQKRKLEEVCFYCHFAQNVFHVFKAYLWSGLCTWLQISRCGYFCSESLNLILVPSEGTEPKLFIRILLTLSVSIKLASHKVPLYCYSTCISDSTFTTNFKGDVCTFFLGVKWLKWRFHEAQADVCVEVHAGKHSYYRPFLC